VRTKEQRTLVAAMDNLNGELTKITLKVLQADLDQAAWPLTVDEEVVLAMQAVRVAQQLLLHSRRQQQAAGAATGPATPMTGDAKETRRSNDSRTS
jgi:hypothetical protein